MQNLFKSRTGYDAGLRDVTLMAGKTAEERALRESLKADAKKASEFGDPWAEIEKAMEVKKQIFVPFTYIEDLAGFEGQLADFARTLVRAGSERSKPNAERFG